MARGGVFDIISAVPHTCYNCQDREEFNKKFIIDLSKYKCICNTRQDTFIEHKSVNVYNIDVSYGCLSCMSKFVADGLCDEGFTYCEQRYHSRNSYLNFVDGIKEYMQKNILKFGLDYAFDFIIHVKYKMHYDINDLYLCFDKPLNINQIRILLAYNWLPSYNFLQPYMQRSHIKTVIEIKKSLLKRRIQIQSFDYEYMFQRKEDKELTQKTITRVSRLIKQYNSMRTNLYIMSRAGLLCNDIAESVEQYICGPASSC